MPKNLLSCGQGNELPISHSFHYYCVLFRFNTTPLTDSCWSPTQPGVFFTTSMGGSLNVWDLCLKQTTPTLTIQVHMFMLKCILIVFLKVCDDPLHGIRVHEQGRLVACGSHSGNTTVLELSEALSSLQPNEKQNINAVCS